MALAALAEPGSRRRYRHTTSTDSWVQIANSDFPGLDPGQFTKWTQIKCFTSANADGSGFYYKIGGASVPANDDEGTPVSGSGQTPTIPGWTYGTNFYIRKITAGDELHLEAQL